VYQEAVSLLPAYAAIAVELAERFAGRTFTAASVGAQAHHLGLAAARTKAAGGT